MRVTVVVSHPSQDSLSKSVSRAIAEHVGKAGHEVEHVDLAAEGFDPRFGAADIATVRGEGPPSPDVVAEQRRLDRTDALVLVYPIYWWSMPALLKGWIDRVFIDGWAFVEATDGGIEKRLGHLPVHLVALGGANLRTQARRGYFGAMRTQIDQGIFDYCGAPVLTSELLVSGEVDTPAAHLDRARTIADRVVAPPATG